MPSIAVYGCDYSPVPGVLELLYASFKLQFSRAFVGHFKTADVAPIKIYHKIVMPPISITEKTATTVPTRILFARKVVAPTFL